jgi:DNA repair exonuclease SbcCD ATPase subunit
MIIFKKIKYKNFLSTGDSWTEVELNKSNHTLIVGQNGSGKSTMLDALSYALFGKSHRNINKGQLVNSINKKGMRVEVEFTIGNKDYKIVRGLKPVKFEIYIEGTLLNQNSHNKEYQKILESNILKLTHKTFHQVVVLGSSSFIPFMQLSALNRREVIEDLLDIGVFSKMNSLLRERNASLKEQIIRTSHSIEVNDTKIEAQKKYIREISRINNDAKTQKESKIKELQQEIQELCNWNAGEQLIANGILLETNPMLEEQQRSSYELKGYETSMQSNIKTLVKETKFYENNENCPTCHQDIEGSLKDKKIQEAKSKAKELLEGITEIQLEQSKIEASMNLLGLKIEEAKQKLNQVQINSKTIENHTSSIENLRKEIEHLSDNKSDLSKANDEFDILVQESHRLIEEKTKLNDQSAYNSVMFEMLKDTGIKTKIIKQYLPVINKLVNQYLNILDFYVHFDLDGSFSETIKSRHRDSFTYDSFSEGEKQRIDLALLFTWRQVAKMKNSISTNLLVLDETFDSSLDEAGIENLLKIIHTLGDETNVFIISHKKESLEGKFGRTLEFYKLKNFSKYRTL